MEVNSTNNENAAVSQAQQRRSANYKPNIWKFHDLLQPLHTNHVPGDDDYSKQVAELKEKLRVMFSEAVGEEVVLLELVDCLQKLGLSNIFEDEIHMALRNTAITDHTNYSNRNAQQDLYIVALRFQMLRLNGYHVSQDVFEGFLDENHGFSGSNDIKSLIALFEASYLATDGEVILEEAKSYTMKSFKTHLFSSCDEDDHAYIRHLLELSSHWRVSWFDVKWHIHTYQNGNIMSPDLIRFAKTHFNVVQATLQNDMRQLAMWWKNVNLMQHMGFARDRLVECFMCSVGLAFEPQFSFFRNSMTKVVIFILLIDDVYDVYGAIDELRHFTTAVKRWDLKEAQGLPEGMKKCLEVLFDVTQEIANEIQKQMGFNPKVLQHLQKVWSDFCEALYVEAKWFNEGHTPSLSEYLNNAWMSSSASVICVHSFFCIMLDKQQNLATLLSDHQDLIYNISIIIRLCNDLATSTAEKERGDVASSVLCYMREAMVSEEEAVDYMKGLVNKSWKNINEKCFKSGLPFHQTFVKVLVNIARVAHNLYQYGDGFGVQDKEMKHQILSLLIQPYDQF